MRDHIITWARVGLTSVRLSPATEYLQRELLCLEGSQRTWYGKRVTWCTLIRITKFFWIITKGLPRWFSIHHRPRHSKWETFFNLFVPPPIPLSKGIWQAMKKDRVSPLAWRGWDGGGASSDCGAPSPPKTPPLSAKEPPPPPHTEPSTPLCLTADRTHMRCTHIDVQFTFRLIQTRDTTLVTSVAPHFSTTAHPTKRNTGKTVVQGRQGRLLLYDAKAPVCVFSPCVANQDVRASPGSKLPLLASSSEWVAIFSTFDFSINWDRDSSSSIKAISQGFILTDPPIFSTKKKTAFLVIGFTGTAVGGFLFGSEIGGAVKKTGKALAALPWRKIIFHSLMSQDLLKSVKKFS